MSHRHISTVEYMEYSNIFSIFLEKLKELSYLSKVIRNIPRVEIAPSTYTKNQSKLYCLEYSEHLRSLGCSETTFIYSFNKAKLEQVKATMQFVTKKIQQELREYFSQLEFEYHSKEQIASFIEYFGYSPCHGKEDIEILDVSHKIDSLYHRQSTNFRENRHDYKRLLNNPSEDNDCEDYDCSEFDYDEDDICDRCRGGGCPSCEPSFFF